MAALTMPLVTELLVDAAVVAEAETHAYRVVSTA
jgi:hypothetical protein